MSTQNEPTAKSLEASWLRNFAKDRFKHGTGVRDTLVQIADLLDMTIFVRDRQGELLTIIANIIKGQPPEGTMHGIQDLPEIIEGLMRDANRRAQPTPELH